ncbi:MAG: hypothetical protein IPO02_10490 [Bacteroidetes bacterium]|nr:hypothetical protein [Bacteroidota bacterium]
MYYNYVRRLNGTKECNIVGFYTKKKDTLILTSQKQPSGEKLLVEELFTSKFDSIVVNIIINYSKLFFELDAKRLIINGRTYHLHPKNYFDSIITVKIPTQFIEYMTVEGSSYVHRFLFRGMANPTSSTSILMLPQRTDLELNVFVLGRNF